MHGNSDDMRFIFGAEKIITLNKISPKKHYGEAITE